MLLGADKLRQSLLRVAKRMGNGKVAVGFMEGATYPNGTPVAAVAFWNEYGHGGQFPAPPRPFFRPMIAEESPTWAPKLARLMKGFDYDGNRALGVMGEDIQGALRSSITNLVEPPLSDTTKVLREIYGQNTSGIRARDVLAAQELVAEGYTGVSGTGAKPLINSGHMLDSIEYEVKS